MSRTPERSRAAAGVAYAAAAYLFWGLFPAYFRTLAGVPPPEILAHRIVWSAAFVALLVTARGSWGDTLRQLRVPRTVPTLAVSAIFISLNWLTYIWAVNNGHVLEASLGYFVNPLVTVLLGVIFLRDHLSRIQVVSICLAGAGVLALVVRAGHVPWIALALALTFGAYGLIRKRVRVDAVPGLLAEVAVLAPVALAYLLWLGGAGAGHFGRGLGRSALLASAGVVTAVPLIWFANGVQRLRLSTIGVLQYLNPTMQFLIAVFAFGELFTRDHAIAFGCIWLSLVIYTAEAVALSRRPAAAGAGR
ncbi:EamA family transporter RarD [Anaeromyxobacter paludicola]|uniref:Chloramphenicol resistance permease RarD n=1 Tax=Anaeromyxobacter paludicola TaxID=2918171 RepID=A0ABN6NCY3_9BACT|nr:EamA family transporter RarD [Anaeromyxobacter paludicola]BDG09808.1 chloramphenicol resistance permease RarD [Anaeromyxobacter paludicola]